MTNSTGWVLFCALLVGGCVHFSPKPVVPAESFARYQQRSLDAPGLHEFLLQSMPGDSIDPWPKSTWDVDSLALAALYFRPDMELARTRWVAARAALVTAGQRPNPVLGFSPQYNTSSSKISPWTVPLTLGVPIETAGKRSARLRYADQLARSVWWEITSTAWRVRSDVQQNLLALQAARESAQLIQQQLHVQLDLVSRMQAQLMVGEISSFELAQSRAIYQTLQLARLDAERDKAEAETRLAAAIGISSTAAKAVNLQFIPLDQAFPDISIPQARRQALLNRADIRSALAGYEATQEKLRLEIARQYPNISLGPGYEFDQDDNKWGLGLSVVLPVLNHNEGPVAEAEARRAEAAAKFAVLQARVVGEIDGAVAVYQSQTKTVVAAERLVSISTQQERNIRIRKKVGELSRLDELSARAILLKAQLDLLRARIRLRESFSTLENTLQSPGILPKAFTVTTEEATTPESENPQTAGRI